ncbi:ABC transporter substrate-binding protein [Roseobacter sp. HKCCA0434]|uniref:ABC transporter substrate-binding protein n=1 Tax=Roseobacter sp. HKCCA0434 TaxID=3079297 RepID=UPI002905D07C|nr:ABC transporter substrate-binding protein [Roseobacter sp. HKCCA0434]
MIRMTLTLAALLLAGAAEAQSTSIRVGMQVEPPSLDPTTGPAGATDEVVYANVFEGLTRFGPDGAIQPALARAWSTSEDGLEWTFTLVEDATFHDGTPFDAKDVAFSLDRARAEGSTNAQAGLFANIAGVEVLSPRQVRLTLAAPSGDLPFQLAWGDAVIVAEESAGDNARMPVGTGPFRLTEWVPGERIELERYADYWGDLPALESATFRFLPDPEAALAALEAGEVDAFPNFPALQALARFDDDPDYQVITGTTEGETILAMNNAAEPFNDMQVRKAVAVALDRDAIIAGAMEGYATPIGSHFPPHHPAYVDLTDLSAHDPDTARELLAGAGYPDGFSVELTLPPPAYAQRSGEIVVQQLAEVGIEVETRTLDWPEWLETVYTKREYDMTIVSHTEPMDIDIYARDDFYFGYADPAFDAIVQDLALVTDPTERRERLQDAQRHIAEAYVNAFLFQLPKTGVADARLRGLWENAPTQAIDLTGVSWVE